VLTRVPQPRPEPLRAREPAQRREPSGRGRTAQAQVREARPERAQPAVKPEPLEWPKTFDDWMIDIVRRRALRLNSGARRRGVTGSVRAVELAYILDRSADKDGRWRCAICNEVVTLDDLSFDHVVALADGGEHAGHNLVPAHRKCNEIKGSEKAQARANALDRWLSEWASAAPRTPQPAYAAATPVAVQGERRYA
jgi:5-methylcytosine-specific restriction endonuclease McrA